MKNQTKITLIIIILIIIGLIVFGILFLNKSEKNNIPENNSGTLATLGLNPRGDGEVYMYTKAICNSTNFCQDNEIICQGNKTISIIPVEGAVIQHSSDWQDPRTKEQIEKLC